MEHEQEIAELKARIARLEKVNKILASTVWNVREYVKSCGSALMEIGRHGTHDFFLIADSAIKASKSLNEFERAIHHLPLEANEDGSIRWDAV